METKISLEAFFAEAKRLKTAITEADNRFLEYLVWGETQRHLWEDTGLLYPTFLERNLQIAIATRYIEYKKVRDLDGAAAVEGLSIRATTNASKIKDSRIRNDYLKQVRNWQETNGKPISDQTADRLARDARVRESTHRTKQATYAELAELCERQKARIKELETRCAALKTENATLRSQCSKKRKAT